MASIFDSIEKISPTELLSMFHKGENCVQNYFLPVFTREVQPSKNLVKQVSEVVDVVEATTLAYIISDLAGERGYCTLGELKLNRQDVAEEFSCDYTFYHASFLDNNVLMNKSNRELPDSVSLVHARVVLGQSYRQTPKILDILF